MVAEDVQAGEQVGTAGAAYGELALPEAQGYRQVLAVAEVEVAIAPVGLQPKEVVAKVFKV